MEKLTLVSFDLCPYVQRAVIVLAEKGIPFDRIDIDLAAKPDWFLRLSPTGRVPLLKVGEEVLFESAAIIEYLDETHGPRLHPEDPVTRARHRAWMDQGSALLGDLWTLETTKNAATFDATCATIRTRLARLAEALGHRTWFGGDSFSLVDAVFAPAFRYFDTFEVAADLHLIPPELAGWRARLAARPSVRGAVGTDYADRLRAFIKRQEGVMATRIA
ncbi:glutathione S-transferase family protein [Tabrizicola sp. TH137]|uniref:glutathione S-transferase family protein n=1 Tax=Tabrizicola sp. TH137 TaxID=2067452 RepID=UPI001C1FB09C